MDLTYAKVETPGDREVVRGIVSLVWPVCYSGILSNEQISYMLDMMYSDDVIIKDTEGGVPFWICYLDGTPAAIISYAEVPDEKNTVELHKIYLLPDFWGKGIGNMILSHVCEVARSCGASAVELRVNKHNERAMKAYGRAGFSKVKSVVSDIGCGFVMDDYLMRKELL